MIFGAFLFVLKTSVVLALALMLTHRSWFSAAVRHLVLLVALISIPLMYFLEGVSVAWLRVDMPEFLQLWILEANNWLVSSGETGKISIGALIIANLKIVSPIVTLIYSFGALALLCYWFAQVFTTGKRVWDTHLFGGERINFRASLGRQVSFRQSCLHESPYTWGIFRPVIVVPLNWPFWSKEKRNSVLVHEKAHIQRLDTLTGIVSVLLCCVCWYNPLVWIARRRLMLLAEQACDDQVVNQEVLTTEYASHLLEIVRSESPNFAPAVSGNCSLSRRIHALLDNERKRDRLKTPQLVLVLAASIALIVPIGLVNTATLPYSLQPAHPIQEASYLQSQHYSTVSAPLMK